MIACTPRPTTAAPGFRCRNCSGSRARADRRRRAALLRRADQPQPPRHHRDRRAGNSRALPGRRSGCRGAGAELPGLPPDRQPGRAASGGQWHFHGRDGLRQGHRRARRGAAVSVLRFSARQFGWQAARPDSQAFTLELALRVLESAPGAANHRAVAAALERGCLLETRLQQCRDARAPRNWRGGGANSTPRRQIARGLRESAA